MNIPYTSYERRNVCKFILRQEFLCLKDTKIKKKKKSENLCFLSWGSLRVLIFNYDLRQFGVLISEPQDVLGFPCPAPHIPPVSHL